MPKLLLPTVLAAALVVSLGAGAYVGITEHRDAVTQHNDAVAQHNHYVSERHHAAELSSQLTAQKAATAAAQAEATSCGKRADAWGQGYLDQATLWTNALSHVFDSGYNVNSDPAAAKVMADTAAGNAATCSTSHLAVPNASASN